jgi:hypothetical protein
MKCDACGTRDWKNYQIRRHPENPHPWTDWHIHYCQRCGWLHDYRELAAIIT